MRIKSFGLGNPGIAVFAVLAAVTVAPFATGAQTLPPPGSFQPIAPGPAPGSVPPPAAPTPGSVQVGPAATPTPSTGTVQIGPAPARDRVR